ncbi:MAG: AAA family ATPase [Myxococcota bacterium]
MPASPICSACQHENPADARFCLRCGARLGILCASCGHDLPSDARFCQECGHPVSAAESSRPSPPPAAYTPKHLADKILRSKSALEGERKQVTVLFADVKGSVHLSGEVDPEEWHAIMDRFSVILSDGVHRYEGTVNQYTGDGIMALFGAPIAHEDHAQRACYSALHLRDEARRYADEVRRTSGLNFSVRIGLNSGEVVVGKIGDDLRMDYTAHGQTVGLASRVEELAEPGRAYLTDQTARLVEGFFELRDLGEFDLKGATRPLRVHELEQVGAARTRLEVSRSRGLTRFVGRRDEMAVLEAALSSAREGQGAVVGVVGEAGVGKSRLCLEFVERCRSTGIAVYEAHCPMHGKTVPYLSVLQLLRSYFGIEDRDSDRTAREKLAGRLLLLDETFQDMLPLVFEFLGVADPDRPGLELDPELRQRQLHAFLRRLIQATAEREPVVVLLDDLHWIDPSSDGFVAQLVEAVTGTRTLLLTNFRPEYSAGWTRRSYYRQLALGPLSSEALAELLRDLLGDDASLTGLAERVEERTGGNPFFAEEVLRDLIESCQLAGAPRAYRLVTPVEALDVPDTVQTVLAARIDRLAERDKYLLQTAAVIGKEFLEPLLREVAELPETDLKESLETLRDAEFIHQQALYPEVEYAFNHPLTQAVSLESQLQDRRRHTHAAVARGLEELNAERLDENAALIAQHWEQGGAALDAARWHRRAAVWAGTTDAAESSRHWRSVRELLATVETSAETDALGIEACRGLLNLGWRLGMGDSDAVFAEGRVIAERSGDLRSLAILFNLYGNAVGTAGDLSSYRAHATEALRIAEQLGDDDLRLGLAADLSVVAWWLGDLEDARALVEPYLHEPVDPWRGDFLDFPPGFQLLWVPANALMEMGRLHEASTFQDRVSATAREAGHPETVAFGKLWRVPLEFRAGSRDAALACAVHAFDQATAIGTPLAMTWAHIFLGLAHLQNEDWDKAASAETEALRISRERGAHFGFAAWAHAWLAEAELGRGDHVAALKEADEAITLGRQYHARPCEMDGHLARARVLLRSDGPAASSEIEATLARVEALIEETGARCRLAPIEELRAELAAVHGDSVGRERHLHEAHRLYTGMGATGHVERVGRELDALTN